jgi:hypothetical protein
VQGHGCRAWTTVESKPLFPVHGIERQHFIAPCIGGILKQRVVKVLRKLRFLLSKYPAKTHYN